MSLISVGFIKIYGENDKIYEYLCFEGIVKVHNNEVSILTDDAHLPTKQVLKEIEQAIKVAKSQKSTISIPTADLIKAERQLRYRFSKKIIFLC